MEAQEGDDDVLAEKQIIEKLTTDDISKDDYRIVLRNATKYYRNFLAVNGICLGIKKFECFGLLGSNGAGKSTTFMMMTGNLRMSYGDIYIQGYSLKHQPKKTHKFVGYCPQFDALLNELTAKETLLIFALIRGVPLRKCNLFINDLATKLDFIMHLQKQVQHLSGGNKRKLSTAIALTGTPKIVLLDEPTTGMDPSSKRNLWNSLSDVRSSGKCLVLSSHSMEECEALCTRVAIMVNGNLKCLGTTQHLRQKFARGYILTIKIGKVRPQSITVEDEQLNVFQRYFERMNSNEISEISESNKIQQIENYIGQHIPNSKLKEQHYEDILVYSIVNEEMKCSQLFDIMEKAKRILPIEDYSIGQSNLEQVFLSFTRHQYINQKDYDTESEFEL